MATRGQRSAIRRSAHARQDDAATAVAKEPERTPLLAQLQRSAGNRAAVGLLAGAQPKLTVGAANDPAEHEADAFAKSALRRLAPHGPLSVPANETGPSGDAAAQRRPEREGAIGPEGGDVDASTESAISRSRGGGEPLPEPLRGPMESAFGADFSQVSVHRGAHAASLNERVGARAFTVGSDIFLGRSAPSLASRGGQELLAHELTHTLQQGGGVKRDLVQRDNVSVKDRIKFFQSGGSSLETKPAEKPKISTGVSSFQEALEVFKRHESESQRPGGAPTGGESAPPTESQVPPTSETLPTETATTETPTTEVHETGDSELPGEKSGTAPETPTTETSPGGSTPAPELRSLGGNDSWRGKSLEGTYKRLEKANYNPKTGKALAEWLPDRPESGPRAVKYLTEDERASYELMLQKGTNLFFWRGEPLDTTQMKRLNIIEGRSGTNRVIFVMTLDGAIYVANEGAEALKGFRQNDGEQWRFNHSSFVQGKKVAAAGELLFEKGVLKGVTDSSGHYKPDITHTVQVLRKFQSAGVDLSQVAVDLYQRDTVDAETLLSLGTAGIAKKLLGTITSAGQKLKDWDPDDDHEDTDDEGNDYTYSQRSLLVDASEALRGAATLGSVDLTAKAWEVLKMAREVMDAACAELADDSPSRQVAAGQARAVLGAFGAIDAVNGELVPHEARSALDALVKELDRLDGVDKSDRDFKTASDAAEELYSSLMDAEKPSGMKSGDDVDKELGEKSRAFGRVEMVLPEARAAVEETRDDHQVWKLRALYTKYPDAFIPATRSAAAKLGLSLSGVVDLALGGMKAMEPSKATLAMLEALRPGASKDYFAQNEDAADKLAELKKTVLEELTRFDDGGDLGEVSFELAIALLNQDEDDFASFAEQALSECLQVRLDAKKPVGTVEELLKRVLLPGVAEAEKKGEPDDALSIMKLANELKPKTFAKDALKAMKKRAKQARRDSDDDD